MLVQENHMVQYQIMISHLDVSTENTFVVVI